MNSTLVKKEPLEFPRGVRFPRAEEIPGDSRAVLKRISKACITTGYTIQKTTGDPFDTYIEANIHASNVFDVFRKLVVALMPDMAAPLIGLKEEKPVYGPYTDRALAIAVFEPYVYPLQNDGFLEFGIIHQSVFAFEEVFVASPKYFRIWTNSGGAAEDVLVTNRIPRCETLEFIDEYPMVNLSIGADGNAEWVKPFYAIKDEFRKLAQPIYLKNDQ